MNFAGITTDEKRVWVLATGVALSAHSAAAALVLLWSQPAVISLPEPVIMIELPPEAAPASVAATQQEITPPQPDYTPPHVLTPPIDVPPVRAPLPKDPVTLPPVQQPVPVRQAVPVTPPATAAKPVVTTPAGAGTGASAAPGSDPRAKRAEVDYFSLISAHLNRRKTYPADAKKARQEGIVTVRFSVDRNGNVSNVSIRKSSGHDILDAATLQLLQRVAPLPRMPAAMQRETVTVSLPIDYSLKTA